MSKLVSRSIKFFLFSIVTIILMFVFVEKVPEGKVAVVYSPSGGVTKVLDPGWHGVLPFHKTQEYPTKITIISTTINITTKDGKKITMPVRYEMKVDKTKILAIFRELGSQNIEQIQEGYLYQRLFQSSRTVISEYSVLEIFGTKASEASSLITDKMADASKDLGFMITNVILGNPEVDPATQQAIDARVQAAQVNELKKIELENEKIEAEKKAVIAKGEADKAVISAKGEADSNVIIAESQAEANRKLAASLTDEILRRMEMEARIEHGWITIQGATPIVDTTK